VENYYHTKLRQTVSKLQTLTRQHEPQAPAALN